LELRWELPSLHFCDAHGGITGIPVQATDGIAEQSLYQNGRMNIGLILHREKNMRPYLYTLVDIFNCLSFPDLDA
jgi:hypothetical protein